MKHAFIVISAFLTMTTGAMAQKSTVLKVSPSAGTEESKEIVLSVDNRGFINVFDGVSLDGWRGYGRDTIPAGWGIENGCLTYTPGKGGGDIIFPHDFENFECEFEWMISKGGNSGMFYLAQETYAPDENGNTKLHPIYISCPEFQLLDNVNHKDAKLGVDGNRKSSSLYDMVPAKPQNAKPWGEWNTAKVVVKNGKVSHYQNGKKVLTYTLWTPQWTEALQASKFSQKKWPIAFKALNTPHDGFIGFQDHGDKVWIRSVKVKPLN